MMIMTTYLIMPVYYVFKICMLTSRAFFVIVYCWKYWWT